MEKLIIFRMFLCFPLIGLLLPDASVWLSNTPFTLPLDHIILEAVLVILIGACSARIAILKKRENNIINAG